MVKKQRTVEPLQLITQPPHCTPDGSLPREARHNSLRAKLGSGPQNRHGIGDIVEDTQYGHDIIGAISHYAFWYAFEDITAKEMAAVSDAGVARHALRVIDHLLGKVDADHAMASTGERNAEPPGAGANVQDRLRATAVIDQANRVRQSTINVPAKPCVEPAADHGPPFTGIDGVEAGDIAIPVLERRLCDHSCNTSRTVPK